MRAAQTLDLNSYWVAFTYNKAPCELEKGENLHIVVAHGYSATQGAHRKANASRPSGPSSHEQVERKMKLSRNP